MIKHYILKYEMPTILPLTNYIDYKLYIETVWFWGWFKTYEVKICRIYDHQNSKSHFDNWDKLITNKQPL